MNWGKRKLTDVCEIQPSKSQAKELHDKNINVSFMPMNSLGIQSKNALTGIEKKLGSVYKAYTYFSENDVLLAKITPCFENGKLGIARGLTNGIGFGSSEFIVLRSGEQLSCEYLYYYLRRAKFIEEGRSNMSGAVGHKRVTAQFIANYQIPMPPLQEQKRIAAILDQAEELKQKRQRSLELLDELKQAIFIDMFGDPDTNPHNFQRKKLGEIINFVGGSQPSKANFVYEHNEGLVRLVQIRDFKSDKNIVYVPAHLAKRPFSTEDIMIGRYGPPVFQILRGLSGTYNVALMKAEPIDDISKEFIYYLLKEPRLHNFVVANSERTAGQSGVNLKLLNEYPAYLPPKDVQTKFDAKIANVSKLEESIIQSSHLSEELFTSLQHKAFSGELSGTA